MKTPLTLKVRDWDFWTPLLLGDVVSEALDIKTVRVKQLIDNVAEDPQADAAEMSLSRYNLRVDQGKADGIVAVPFFIMRGFRTRNIVTVKDSPLKSLKDLEGKTIGLSGWQDSGNTWTRALLRREGVDCDKINWVLTRCTRGDAVEPDRGRQFWNGSNTSPMRSRSSRCSATGKSTPCSRPSCPRATSRRACSAFGPWSRTSRRTKSPTSGRRATCPAFTSLR